MRTTLTRLAIIAMSLFAATALSFGAAHADELEPTVYEEFTPQLEFCFEPNPEDCEKDDGTLEVTCPPLCLEPEDEPEEPEEPEAPEQQEEPDGSGQGDGGTEGADTSAETSTDGTGDADAAEVDDAIVAPVNDLPEVPTGSAPGGSPNAALIAFLVAVGALGTAGGLAYVVTRRR